MTNIVTPCHGEPLLILTASAGSGHLTYDKPDEIMCTAPECYNSWDALGVASEYNE